MGDVKEIKLTYEDGTEVIVAKGFFANITEAENDEIEVTFSFINISGSEIGTIVGAVYQLGEKLGMCDGSENDKDDDSPMFGRW